MSKISKCHFQRKGKKMRDKIKIKTPWESDLERHMVIRGLSQASINAYVSKLRAFSIYINGDPRVVTIDDIERYQYSLATSDHYNYNSYRSHVHALRYFFTKVMNHKFEIENIPLPKTQKKLPEVFTPKEISRLFLNVPNPRSRHALKALYASGMRVSELLNLKISDIDGDRGRVRIVNGKGKKDRELPLWDSLREVFRDLYRLRGRKSSPYLLTCTKDDGPASDSTLRKALKEGLRKSGIKKNGTLHTFRHSFATHQMERGKSFKEVQEYLGHKDYRQTMVYLHFTEQAMSESICLLDHLPDNDKF
jgi:site-specific recombinase XerD